MMSFFICPLCGSTLEGDKTLKCINGHSFDRAKSGYVNLLSGKGGNHGDPKEMVIARRDFLDSGYYEEFADVLCDAVMKYSPDNARILDCGCGECYYTKRIADAFNNESRHALFAGIDVSKDAVNYGAKRFRECELAAASVYAMPVADQSVDTVISVFAPAALEEFHRVLKPGGYLLMAIGSRNHLWSLKKAVYDTPYKNEPSEYTLDGFKFIKSIPCSYNITLKSNKDILDLFSMTPYYHKTSKSDIAKLNSFDTLETEVDFEILVYSKNEKLRNGN
ncbi:MAG: methyltransferase domain-containing protein [Ruminococcaceae bacterium]|nr:methyltransferase domain-containing protein [Oscillospiraceae bacterium]